MMNATKNGTRYVRMPLRSAVFMVRNGHSWTSDLVDISATGVLCERPPDWEGDLGDDFVLDIMISEELDLHVDARVARATEDAIGFSFERIPAEKEIPLWQILGRFADAKESKPE